MVREESSPGSGSRGSASAPATFGWLLPAVLTAVATAVTTALAADAARVPVAVVGGIATVAVAAIGVEAARRGRAIDGLRRRITEREALLARRDAETAHLAGTLLPDAVERLRRGDFPEDVLASLPAPEAHQAVVRTVVDAVVAEEDLRDSAQRAFVNIARRVQAIVHQQAQELREMEDRHGKSPEVFGDLLRIDHGTALIGRLADSIAVLGGARPGRQWSRAVPLYSVLRGAMSRIIDYQRVELHSVSEVAVVGSAVEPLIHALAELLDNATRYSPPQAKVHLTAVEVQSGIAIEIEDGGVSMSEEARRRAERTLRQAQQGLDLTDLGETPRLGLAVVGRLAQAYGFQVSLRSSAYGGVRAVLVVPQSLITAAASATGLAHGIGASSGPRATATPGVAAGPVRAAAAATATTARPVTGPTAGEGQGPVVTERTANGLPQRRRKHRITASADERAAGAGVPPAGRRLGATAAGAGAPGPAREGSGRGPEAGQGPGQTSGTGPESAQWSGQGDEPGRGSVPGQAPGTGRGHETGHDSAHEPGPGPGHGTGQGQAPGAAAGHPARHGQGPGQGPDAGHGTGHSTTHEPGTATGHPSGQDQAPGTESAQGPGHAPGAGHATGTAHEPGAAAGHPSRHGQRPGQGPDAGHGTGHSTTHEPGTATGHPSGQDQAPGTESAQGPGTGPGRPAGQGSGHEPRRGSGPSSDHRPSDDGSAPPQVQPGMWLAAFQSGLSGGTTEASKGNTQP
ncbi:ATP-binding protein [Streptomyces sp. PR69]|uniref:ATP-binding protein n=1 Tax=Streptomyces sp. PR69 TaxID=2984950 RepID=UPI0022653422|nr:ATP-binding protein [Streptomyces sp. PR69]